MLCSIGTEYIAFFRVVVAQTEISAVMDLTVMGSEGKGSNQ